jgi:hypothetical protein
VLVLVTENSAGSEWVRAEVNTALADPRFSGRILPVKHGTVAPGAISASLGPLHCLDLSKTADVGTLLANFLSRREVELRGKARGAQ